MVARMHVRRDDDRALCGARDPKFAYRLGVRPLIRDYAPLCERCERIAARILAEQAAKWAAFVKANFPG